MAPRRRKSTANAAAKRKKPLKKKAVRKLPVNIFENMAKDPTSPRLLGCTFLQTKIPKMMQTKSEKDLCLRFQAAFLTKTHFYGFYYENLQSQLQLGRLCLFSQTWELVPEFRYNVSASSDFKVIPLPLNWAKKPTQAEPENQDSNDANEKEEEEEEKEEKKKEEEEEEDYEDDEEDDDVPLYVILLDPNRATLMELGANGLSVTLTPFDLREMLVLPEGVQVTVHLQVLTNWYLAAVDPVKRVIYFQLEIGCNGILASRDLALFKLEWDSRRWTRLEPANGQSLVEGSFMAVHENHLFFGIVEISSLRLTSQGDWTTVNTVALTEMQTFHLETKTFERFPVFNGVPRPEVASHQVNLQFHQLGDTVYILNAVLNAGAVKSSFYQNEQELVAKNQLWALQLPSLEMRQINDGPAVETKKVKEKPLEESGIPGFLRSRKQISLSIGHSSNSCELIASDPIDQSSTSQHLMMRYYGLVAAPDGGELVAFNKHSLSSPSHPIKLFRISLPVRGIPSLASLTLGSVLLQAPVEALVTQPMGPRTRGTRGARGRRIPKQERSVPYLREFMRKVPELSHAVRHLPEDEAKKEEARRRKKEKKEREAAERASAEAAAVPVLVAPEVPEPVAPFEGAEAAADLIPAVEAGGADFRMDWGPDMLNAGIAMNVQLARMFEMPNLAERVQRVVQQIRQQLPPNRNPARFYEEEAQGQEMEGGDRQEEEMLIFSDDEDDDDDSDDDDDDDDDDDSDDEDDSDDNDNDDDDDDDDYGYVYEGDIDVPLFILNRD